MWDQGGRNVPLEMLMGLPSAGKALWEERGWRWLWVGPAEGTAPLGGRNLGRLMTAGGRAKHLAQPGTGKQKHEDHPPLGSPPPFLRCPLPYT